MNKMMKDRNGYAPTAEPHCDAAGHEECLGAFLCYHPLEMRTRDESHTECPEWCTQCDEGVDDQPGGRGPVWTWCPEREN